MKIKKSLVWVCLLAKRLLLKVSFVALLCLIPILVNVANTSMQSESGVLRIILCTEKENIGADDAINAITQRESIMLFEKSCDLQTSLKALERKDVDAVWYFEKNLDEKINLYASGKSGKPFITVYEREDSIPLKLSREKLFGAIYNKFSYFVYRNFAYSEIVSREEVTEETLKNYYDRMERGKEIIKIKGVSNANAPKVPNYLSSPLRGILSVLIMLCGFAGAMYFIKDRENGKFDWLAPYKRIMPAFAQCLASVMLAAVSVFVAMYFAGIMGNLGYECVCMILFVIAAAGVSLCLSLFFQSSGKLGASIPAWILLMMVLSPIFFNVEQLTPVRLLLPTHYYLYSIYDANYILYFLWYIIGVYTVAIVVNYRVQHREDKHSLLA